MKFSLVFVLFLGLSSSGVYASETTSEHSPEVCAKATCYSCCMYACSHQEDSQLTSQETGKGFESSESTNTGH